MWYEYKNERGEKIEREYSMRGEIPREIEEKGEVYRRVWNTFTLRVGSGSGSGRDGIQGVDRGVKGKSLDDFRRSKISKGYVKMKDKGKEVLAQLRVDSDGAERLVYKSNPAIDTGIKVSDDMGERLSKNMENYI